MIERQRLITPIRDGRFDARTGMICSGSPSLCPVILIHGVGLNSSIWMPQIKALAGDYRVVAFDLLGHGESSLPPEDVTLGDLTDQLHAIMNINGFAKAHLVGHSMGAVVALDYALTHPTWVLSIIGLNAVYCRSPSQRAAVETRSRDLVFNPSRAFVDQTIERWFGTPDGPVSEKAEPIRSMLNGVSMEGYGRVYRLFAQSDDAHRHSLQDLRPPAMFLTGSDDPNSTPAMSEAMAAAAPYGSVHIFPGLRHLMAWTEPDVINPVITSFLADHTHLAMPSTGAQL